MTLYFQRNVEGCVGRSRYASFGYNMQIYKIYNVVIQEIARNLTYITETRKVLDWLHARPCNSYFL